MGSPIASNLKALHGRIEAAARHAGRDPGSIVLVGVSKTVDKERIVEAIEAGLHDLGENRVQEAREKIPLLPATVRWHLVGHLQSNKVNQAARLFQVVHSIDSADLLRRLDQAAAKEGRRIEALVQVDLAGEASKFGVGEERLEDLVEAGAACGSVAVRGLMILPPQDPDPEKARPYFRRLRRLLEEARARHRTLPLDQLSMGMSEDFEMGIEEGATMIRVGRALFGERPTLRGGGA